MINSSSNSRYLLIVEDPQGRRTIPLEEMKYSLGRKSDNQIVLRSKHASRYHATLIKKSIDRQKFSYWILDGDLEGNILRLFSRIYLTVLSLMNISQVLLIMPRKIIN